MEDRWFVYAEGSLSADAVRGGGCDQEAHLEKMINRHGRPEQLEVFEVSFPVARWLRRSVKDDGQPWTLRFFRLTASRIYPAEEDPISRKSPKVEATKRAVRAAQKARAGKR